MEVRELVTILQGLPNQNAIVVIGDGDEHETWLLVSGVVERRISRSIRIWLVPASNWQLRLCRTLTSIPADR